MYPSTRCQGTTKKQSDFWFVWRLSAVHQSPLTRADIDLKQGGKGEKSIKMENIFKAHELSRNITGCVHETFRALQKGDDWMHREAPRPRFHRAERSLPHPSNVSKVMGSACRGLACLHLAVTEEAIGECGRLDVESLNRSSLGKHEVALRPCI